MEKDLNEYSKEELFSLPHRKWDEEKTYDSILLLSTGEPHDSGWAMVAIIGCNQQKPVEIAASCSDDIEWISTPDPFPFGYHFYVGQMRMDCALKSGAMHFWSRSNQFTVGAALSSIQISVTKKAAK